MPSSVQLASIASSLDTYRTQFAALGHALSALRVVSDQMIAQLDRDREALAGHIEAALDVISEAETAGGASETDSEFQDVAALRMELATDDASAAVADHAIDSELVAAETPADPIVEPALLDDGISIAMDVVSEANTETVVSGEVATDATALVTTEPGIAAQASIDAQADAAPAALEETSGEVKSGDEKPGDAKVVSLAERRKATTVASPARRRAMAVVASIFVTATATLGLHELMQTELGQRMLELGTCDGDMLSATRDCSLLAWLLI